MNHIKVSKDTDTALRVVLNVCECKQITALKAENETLKQELQLWKAGKELPEVGKYYTATDELMEMHGWTFSILIALRYDGTQWTTVNRTDGTSFKVFEHVFTAPEKYDDDDTGSRTGWIKMCFETYELHQTSPVLWEECYPGTISFLDHNDRRAENTV